MAQTKYIISLVDRVTAVAARMQGSLRGVTTQAQKAANSINGIGFAAAGAAVGGVFKLGAELESVQLTFNTLTGSVEKGTKLFEELTEFANTTPFQNDRLNKNAKTLLAFGADAEGVTQTLRMLGDIAAGDQNRLDSLTLAFAQSRAAGRLMGQDLLQMINAGFNPLQQISEATGLSLGELKKKMEQGAISFDMVEKAFAAASGPGGKFHNLTVMMADTMAGKWSTAMGKGRFLLSRVGLSLKDAFLPILERAIAIIDRMSQWLDNNSQKVAEWGKAVLTFLPILGGLILALKIFNAVAMANPYVLAIIGIALFITFLIRLWNTFNTMQEKIDEFFDQMGIFGTIVLWPLNKLWNIIREIVAVFKAFKAHGFIEGMKQVGKSILRFVLLPFEQLLKVTSKFGVGGEIYKKLKEFREGLKFVDVAAPETKDAKRSGFNPLGGTLAPNLAAIGLSEDAKKLQAQGVVSGGGIKTFNININTLTGINTLSTTNLAEGGQKAGEMVRDAILKALADVKNVD